MSEKLPKACCTEKAEAPKRTCECRHKATERSVEFQSELQKRLNRAIGQLNGVKSMMRDHLETCVTERVREGDTEVIDEAMQLIKRFAR